MDLNLGPLINQTQHRRIKRYCDQAETDGVPLIASGHVADDVPAGGYFVAPRLYGPVPLNHPLAHEEVFGPVLSLIPFSDEEEAVKSPMEQIMDLSLAYGQAMGHEQFVSDVEWWQARFL